MMLVVIYFTKSYGSKMKRTLTEVSEKGFTVDVGKCSNSNRVINEWNALSEEIIESNSLF